VDCSTLRNLKHSQTNPFRCIYCGRSSITSEDVVLQVEHVHPRDDGGKDILSNLVTACQQCNVEKGKNLLPKHIEDEILEEVARRNKESKLRPKTEIKLRTDQ